MSALGAAAGLALAYWTIGFLLALAPPDVPRLEATRFDGRTIAFAWIVSLVATVLAGIVPGLHTSRWNLTRVLGEGGSRLAHAHRLRRAVVVGEIGLALVLLTCAGLVGRSFVNLLQVDVGFEPANLLTLDITVPEVSPERHNRFYAELLSRIRAMPGVEAAGAVYLRPLEHAGIGMDAPIVIEGQRPGLESRDWEQNPPTNLETVTSEYFRAMGLRVVRGRPFTDSDHDRAPRVAIVSEGLARRLWPGQEPLGRRILFPGQPLDARGQPQWATVVGIVEDARYRGLTDPRFDLYAPYLQLTGMLVKHLMVRTARAPLLLADLIRADAQRLESTVLVEHVATMDQLVGQAVAPWRFSVWTLGLLSGLALALAALGVYAVASQSVVERTREIAVRVAIGARPRQIAGLVLREGLALTAVGISIGLAGGMAAGRILTGLLYEVRPADPVTLGAVAVIFAVVSTAAMVWPTLSAAYTDPAQALSRQ